MHGIQRKKGSKFFKDLKTFTTTTAKLFDIFCKNSTQKFHVEVQDNLRMTDDDFQVSDRARATVATSDLIDHAIVISKDSTFVINKKNLGVNRKNIENIIKQKKLNSSFLSMPYLSTEEMYSRFRLIGPPVNRVSRLIEPNCEKRNPIKDNALC